MDEVVISKRSKLKVYHQRGCMYTKRMDPKYMRLWPKERAKSKGYKPCAWCKGIHGLYLTLRDTPESQVHELKELKLSYDKEDKAVCFRTDIGFWKIRRTRPGSYKLFHLNHNRFESDATDQQLMRREFHRQSDVEETTRIGRIIKYIVRHDKAKKIMDDDWRKLPRQTQQQKEYYNKARKRERRKSLRRIDSIFKQLEQERNHKHG